MNDRKESPNASTPVTLLAALLCKGLLRGEGARASCQSKARAPRMGQRPLLRQRPVAVLDLQHPEGGEVEAEVIGRRHVDDAAAAADAARLFDRVAHLCLVGALRTPQ